MWSRRDFLKLTGAAIAAPSWASFNPFQNHQSQAGQHHYASAFTTAANHHGFGLFDESGQLVWSTKLPDRAHAPVIHPQQSIVGIVARRPGFFMDFFDLASRQHLLRITPSQHHHFYGHAVFNADGTQLISQENHYPTGQGKIVIRDWPTGDIIMSFSSNGIGPHESVRFNGNQLIVANGGLKTHPDNDRRILNLDTMAPNVSYLSLESGRVLHCVSHNEHHQLSIRHLDVNPHGVVALGFQYQGDVRDKVPLVGLSQLNAPTLTYLAMPEPIRLRFKQYCGSVCFDRSGEILAVSSPRGGLVAYWHLPSNHFIGITNARDVCGLATTSQPYEFLMTTGTGSQIKANPVQNTHNLINKHTNYKWDNHLLKINA